jgi:hypothetical protein
MRMYHPGEQPCHMALTSGHSFVVGPEPVEVPQRFFKLAVAKGCVPEGQEPPKDDPAGTPIADRKLEMVKDGVRLLMQTGGVDDFEGDGRPKLEPLSKAVGFDVSGDERDMAYQAVNDDASDD